MKRKSGYLVALTALLIVMAFSLGCTSNKPENTGATIPPSPTTTAKAQAAEAKKIIVSGNPELGQFLVDGKGMTLYLFKNDGPSQSSCYDQCAANWPPMTLENQPVIGEGVPGAIDVISRTDGTTQATYNGMPLYYFANDEKPGETNGQGVKNVWYVVKPISEPETTPTLITTGDVTPTTETTQTTQASIVPTTTVSGPPSGPSGTFIAKASDVPAGSSKSFTYNGANAILVNFNGQYRAYVNSCTHEGCPTNFASGVLRCSCQGSVFDPLTGEPSADSIAKSPLRSIEIAVEGDGGIYVK